jgi:TPR repeat protein/serine/threonine protein kinase
VLESGVLIGGDYRVERKLAEGGMGAVFVAEQVSTGAKRALKIIKPELLHEPKLRQRFEQEARVTSRIASDHVVGVVAAGIDLERGLPWLAMELLQGQTLHQTVSDRGALRRDVACTILRQLAHAIDAAHVAGIVHRDLKPENIFLAEARQSGASFFVKVLDFGIARVVREAHLTRTDALGTPLWMAPEQAGTTDTVGPWTDIWPLGLIAFYVLTGRSFWLSGQGEGTPLGVVREICIDPLPAASERARQVGSDVEVPTTLDPWFARCLSRDVGARFKTAGEAVRELERALGLESNTAPLDPALAPTVHPEPPEAEREVAQAKTLLHIGPSPAAPSSASIRANGAEPAPTPREAPPAVSFTNPNPGTTGDTATSRRLIGRTLGAGALVLAGAIAVFGVRALRLRKDAASCVAGGEAAFDACRRACENGHGAACTRLATFEVLSRDEGAAARSVTLLRTACEAGDADACATVGGALAFPRSWSKRHESAQAVKLLEKGCEAGRGCALLGSLKTLGVPGIAKEASHYFDASCKDSPGPGAAKGAKLDCALAAAHDLEGSPERTLSPRLANVPARVPALFECMHGDDDLCGLSWLDAKASPNELLAAYERGCDAGEPISCNNLGALRAEGGGGLEANPAIAKERFERACEAGEPAGCNNLGFLLGGFVATSRRGPRGATVYKLRCSDSLAVGCAGWGARVHPLPRGTPVDPKSAVAAFQRACDGGLTVACVNAGALFYAGRGTARDRDRAEKLFADSCFRGDASACGEQGTALLALRMDHPRDVRGGIRFLERACNGAELDSCLALYGHLVNGRPDPRREAEGVAGLKRLAVKGLFSTDLVQLYQTGAEGLAPDVLEARRIATQECETDWRCADAAYVFSRGIGGPKDESRAAAMLGKGCEHHDLLSCVELGARYRDGHGVGRDPARAVELFKRACEGADGRGCDELSKAYGGGEGVAKSAERALALSREGCESGSVDSCVSYGGMLADGQGTTKDVDGAVPYLAFGCRRAVPSACTRLQALGKPIPELDP